ncbi:MAG: Gfo/Idh/MocA family protein [Sarcina sp.]
MRIGVIGIGDISKKAYLPVLGVKKDIELVLCTRNIETLEDMKRKYRVKEAYTSLGELIKSGVDGVIINSSTTSHFEIAKELLENKIPVFVDKPISLNYEDAQKLYEVSKEYDTNIMVGFNRRFIPKVSGLKEIGEPDIIIMQKNRFNLPDKDVRTFVYDDFIHVVDTVRFLMGETHIDMTIKYKKDERGILNIMLTLSNENTTAIALMNRDNGITEETIEYMSSGKKVVVSSLVKWTKAVENSITIEEFGDWVPTLHKRGFEDMMTEFISSIKEERKPKVEIEDSLITHKICEEVVNFIIEDNK